MSQTPNAGMVDKNVPSQLDTEDLAAEIEVELPGSRENQVDFMGSAMNMDVEIIPEEDGGVTIDFEPADAAKGDEEFYDNLAENLSEELAELVANYWESSMLTRPAVRSGKTLMRMVWSCLASLMRSAPNRLEERRA